jgi:hypothetical protein
MKFAMQGLEPGTGVLDWLELGSHQSWELNRSWLSYEFADTGLYPFVLTGQTIDRRFYDNLNSYTGEAGSDGVVRVAAASMNFGLIRLVQERTGLKLSRDIRAERSPLGVLRGRSHSGAEIGILASVHPDDDGTHPTVKWVLRCLGVRSPSGFRRLIRELNQLTDDTQEDERIRSEGTFFLFEREFTTSRYCMLVIRMIDHRGHPLHDFDVYFTAGPHYDENQLPPGFFIDRQRNRLDRHKLTYFMDYDVMQDWFARPKVDDRFGFRIVARPTEGFAHYAVAEYKGRFSALKRYFEPNQTLMVEVELQRRVDEGVFQFTQNLEPEDIDREPRGNDLP